jgi:isopentenyl phosphate kinase
MIILLLDEQGGTCYIFIMPLVFLKLGGSLITDKTRPFTLRPVKLDDLAVQIASALQEDADLQLLLGHGSGSFGHEAASRFGTRRGVSGVEAWRGFAEVWYQASTLNRLVVETLHRAGLPVITISPASIIAARDGQAVDWYLSSLQSALANGLLPVIHGDVVFDQERGGTILSTEDLFVLLAKELHPQRILLAGLERGVWADFPRRSRLIREITPENFPKQAASLGSADGIDVTGGMQVKVREMVALVQQIPGLHVQIFSGEDPDNLRRALLGKTFGTTVHR